MPDQFDHLNEQARKVLALAQEEAQRFNHNYIGTEHLLLGLLRLDEGASATVLTNLGVQLDKAHRAVEFIIGRGDRIVVGEIGLTPRSKKVIELAFLEAEQMQQDLIGPEHILLGLVHEGEGIAAGVLESLGVNLWKVRQETYRVLGLTPPPRPLEGEPPSSSEAGPHLSVQIGSVTLSPHSGTPTPVMPPLPPYIGPLHRYRPWHIDQEQPQKTQVGTGATPKTIIPNQPGAVFGTLLGWVIVNTGGAFTLTLYDGLGEDAPSLAIIHHPPTGAHFPFHCLAMQGLTYTLEGTPGSVTIIYDELRE